MRDNGKNRNFETDNNLKYVVKHVFGELDAMEVYADFVTDKLKDCFSAPVYGGSAAEQPIPTF